MERDSLHETVDGVQMRNLFLERVDVASISVQFKYIPFATSREAGVSFILAVIVIRSGGLLGAYSWVILAEDINHNSQYAQ